MQNPEHTSGDWLVTLLPNGQTLIYAKRQDARGINGVIKRWIATVWTPTEGDALLYAEQAANAALIASAPTLLAENARLRESLAEAQKMIEDVSLWAGDGSIPPSKRLEGIQRSIGPGNPPRLQLLAATL